LRLSDIAARKGDFNKARAYLAEAEAYAHTPMEKTLVRQNAVLLEARLGRMREAIEQTLAQEKYLSQAQSPLQVALGVYLPLASYNMLLDDLDAARDALVKARSQLQPPLDKFVAFAEALILIEEDDLEAAQGALESGREVIDQFQLKVLDFQIHTVRARIAEAQEDFEVMEEQYLLALHNMQYSANAADLSFVVPSVYAEIAKAQIRMGKLDEARQSIEEGYQLDPAEPSLWVARAMLQKAQGMSQLALASLTYALAIWGNADDAFVPAGEARDMAGELQQPVL
jgi:tetratricopeptide (TPR) repeat protein